MSSSRVGLWLVGAKGGVATTLLTGLAGLRSGTGSASGLVTAREPFDRLGLVDFADIVVGGHDIRTGSLAAEARRMWTESRAITPEILAAAEPFLAEVERRLTEHRDETRELLEDMQGAIEVLRKNDEIAAERQREDHAALS